MGRRCRCRGRRSDITLSVLTDQNSEPRCRDYHIISQSTSLDSADSCVSPSGYCLRSNTPLRIYGPHHDQHHHPRISLSTITPDGLQSAFSNPRTFAFLSPSAFYMSASPCSSFTALFSTVFQISCQILKHTRRHSKRPQTPGKHFALAFPCYPSLSRAWLGISTPSLYHHGIAYHPSHLTQHTQQFVTSPHLTSCSRSDPIRLYLICITSGGLVD